MAIKRRMLNIFRRRNDTLPSRTREEVDNYIVACLRYHETPVCDDIGPNPFSTHAKTLHIRILMADGDYDTRDTLDTVPVPVR